MEKILNFLIGFICLLITTTAYPQNFDTCSPYFITQPFTQRSSPTYDSKEILNLTDTSPIKVSSHFLSSKSQNWFITLATQQDNAELLLNLFTKSDLSLDDSLYIISTLILPKFFEFKNIDSDQETYKFYELLYDILGMKDIPVLIRKIETQYKELSDLLAFWSPNGIKRAHQELSILIELIQTRTQISSQHKIIKALFQDRPLQKKVYNPILGRKENISLLDTIQHELSDEDSNIIPKELIKLISQSEKFSYLNQITSLSLERMTEIITQYVNSDSLDQACWISYLDPLKNKTIAIVEGIFDTIIQLDGTIRSLNNHSFFLQDNTSYFSKSLSTMIKDLLNLKNSIIKFYTNFSNKKNLVSNEEIYIYLNSSFPYPILSRQHLFTDPQKITHVNLISKVFFNSLQTTYTSMLKDTSGNSHIYDYFTDLYYLDSYDYVKYLVDKYGQRFVRELYNSLD